MITFQMTLPIPVSRTTIVDTKKSSIRVIREIIPAYLSAQTSS
jgi:hypothetical protein